jgi:hypothetical protein
MTLIAVFLVGFLWNKWPKIAILGGTVIFAAGLLPLGSSVIVKLWGVYRVQIIVLDPSGRPTGDAEVHASLGALKREQVSSELEIPTQVLPSDRKINIYASVKDGYLAGTSTVILGADYFPQVSIQLTPLPSVVLRGVVELPDGGSATGARVSVIGYPQEAVTDNMGNFSLPSHVADGQMVTVRAEMGGLEAQYTAPAGSPLTLILRKP